MVLLVFPNVAVAQQSENDANNLPLLDSVQCGMEIGRTLKIQYSVFLQEYVEVNPFLDAMTKELNDDDYTNENPVLDVRVCWCSQYFNRKFEYCPAVFDSCKVDGFDGPITCFQDSQGGAFIRGFWFICIFWFMALTYACTCTEQGASARAFVRRKLCLKCCRRRGTSGPTTERDALLRDIEAMIERDPNRATWLLRSAFLRDRDRRQIQEARSIRRGRGRRQQQQQQQQPPAAAEEGDSNNPESNNNSTNAANTSSSTADTTQISDWNWRQTMELKVKKYDGGSSSKVVGETEHPTPDNSENSTADQDSAKSQDDVTEEEENNNKSTAFSLASAQQFLSSAVSMLNDTATDNTTGDLDGEDVQCAICLSEVNIGDRIGDIPCGHIYCVECLKDWLKRKNHCPLCQRGGLATPQRSSNPASNNSSSSSSGSTESDSQQDAAEEGRASSSSSSPARSSSSSGGGGLIVSMPFFLPSRARRSR